MNQKQKSKLEGKNINLTINLESESKITNESSCTNIKINKSTYSFKFELKENINGDLQLAISIINDEEILIINFDSENSTILTNTPYKKDFSETNSNSLKSDAIIALILPIVFVLADIIGIIIYLKNKKNPDKNESSSRTESITKIIN